jgi:hypothetical protein
MSHPARGKLVMTLNRELVDMGFLTGAIRAKVNTDEKRQDKCPLHCERDTVRPLRIVTDEDTEDAHG